MNKAIKYIIILIFLSNCSFSKKDAVDNDKLIDIFKKNEPIQKQFNQQLKIKKFNTFKIKPFQKNNSNSNGNINFLFGTHSLFQKKIKFLNLGFIIIDEQHKFGVKQRYEITQKGTNVNILVMTATPIPRSLALTAYGDMDMSIIKEKPIGRRRIKTYVLPQSKINEVLLSVERAIKNGALIYWVCPMIENSENEDLIAVNERFDFLTSFFPNIDISLVHGKQNQIDKEKAINDFKVGKSKILVATTVIEVGVDIPDATIMIIECAERFGLSQIHQLRGRVGRSNKAVSYTHLTLPTKA